MWFLDTNLIRSFFSKTEEPAAGLFEGDLFADAPLPQTSMPPIEQDSDDDLDAGWDMGARSNASR